MLSRDSIFTLSVIVEYQRALCAPLIVYRPEDITVGDVQEIRLVQEFEWQEPISATNPKRLIPLNAETLVMTRSGAFYTFDKAREELAGRLPGDLRIHNLSPTAQLVLAVMAFNNRPVVDLDVRIPSVLPPHRQQEIIRNVTFPAMKNPTAG